MLIRNEEREDMSAVYEVNLAAFDTPGEAKLVNKLRKEVHPIISLVAEESEEVVGYILFTPVKLSGSPELKIMGLGPMAVMPAYHGKGIGSALVRAGLEKCKEQGYGAVAVLGHTWFYPRFGFKASVLFDIRPEYDVPEEVFMILELQPDYLLDASGTIQYHPLFNTVQSV
jgi:putative acetyltransferase